MISLEGQKDIVINMLRYMNPFEIRDFLLSRKDYRDLYKDKSFWIYMIKEVYDVNYTGNNPRIGFLRLYIKKNYSRNTKLRDMPSRYHWIFYIWYINAFYLGRWYPISDSSIDRDPMFYGDLMYESNAYELANQEIENGKTVVIVTSRNRYADPMYLGDITKITPSDLFALQDPLDLSLEDFFNGGDNINLGNILANTFTSKDLDYLDIDSDSKIDGIGTRDVQSLDNFVQLKLKEGEIIGADDTIEELSFIGRILYK